MDSPLTPFLSGKDEAGEIRSGLGGWYCGGSGCIERLLDDEELEVL